MNRIFLPSILIVAAQMAFAIGDDFGDMDNSQNGAANNFYSNSTSESQNENEYENEYENNNYENGENENAEENYENNGANNYGNNSNEEYFNNGSYDGNLKALPNASVPPSANSSMNNLNMNSNSQIPTENTFTNQLAPINNTAPVNNAGNTPPMNAQASESSMNAIGTENTVAPMNTPIVNEAPVLNEMPLLNEAPSLEASANSFPVAKPQKLKGRQLSAAEQRYANSAKNSLPNLIPGTAPEEYYVQPRDNLWDISAQFTGDAYWWPRLWALNPSVGNNPNLIYPGMKLVFYPSDGQNAPDFAVSDKGDLLLPAGGPSLINSKALDAVVFNAIPPSDSVPVEKMGEIVDASSLPSDSSFIESVGGFAVLSSYMVEVPGFVSQSEPENFGEIESVDGTQLIPLAKDTAYARFDDDVQPGSRFLTVRKAALTEQDIYVYTGAINVVRKNNNGVYSVLVENSSLGVSSGDKIVPLKNLMRSLDPNSQANSARISSKVIATNSYPGFIAAQGTMLFLEKDDESGARPGEDLNLYMPVGGMVGFENTDLLGKLAGRARIIDITEESMVAIVLEAQSEISVGAQTWPEF